MQVQKFGSDYQRSAHAFAYANKNEKGENYGCRMFWENDTIFSYGYHFIIAKKVRNKNGGVDFVLFSTNKASNTTSKQQYCVERALYQEVINVSTNIKNFNALQEVKEKEKEIIYLVEKISKARAEHIIDSYKDRVKRHIYEVDFLVNYYKIKSKTPQRIKDFIKVKDDNEKLFSLLDIAKKRRKRADKLAEIKAEKLRIEQQKKLIEKEKEQLKKWKNYELKSVYLRNLKHDFLRISEDKQYIETSQGSRTTIQEAKKVLRLIDMKKAIGYKIDEKFVIKSINGVFAVGCHNIPIEEINAFKAIILSL